MSGAPHPPSRRGLLAIAAGAFAAATAITVLFVLPVEMRLDLTGFGRWSGLMRLGAPTPADGPPIDQAATGATAFYATPFRSHTVEIPLKSSDLGPRAQSELEYKVFMKAGDSLVYSLAVDGLTDPDEFYFDFHAQATDEPGKERPTVVQYLQATGAQSHGMLIAPLTGIHGWFLQNQSGGTITVRLRLSGFYDLVPPGEEGNLAGIVAKPAGD